MESGTTSGKPNRPRHLSAAFVATVKAPGYYGDGRGGHGLRLLVRKRSTGKITKSWAQRLRVKGKPVDTGLGPYPLVTLAGAREKALANARGVWKGIDPRAGGIPSFQEACERVIRIHAASWKSVRSERQWRASLSTYAFPKLGSASVAHISTSDVLGVLVPIWNKKPETARRVHQRIGAVMRWSIAQGYRVDNPAGDAVSAALPRVSVERRHHRALPFTNVANALRVIRASEASTSTKLAFEFLTLTACRSGEVRFGQWDEIDLDSAVWTIPGQRMKTGREHRVPLSVGALQVLAESTKVRDRSGLIFPSPTGRVLSDSTLSKLCREHQIGAVPHGMRSSFRDWAAELSDAPREVAEFCLAHVEGSAAERAYRRTDYFERRRALMQEWSDFLMEIENG